MCTARRTVTGLSACLALFLLVPSSVASGQARSVRIRVGDRTVEVLGLSWADSVVLGKFDSRDPTKDESLRQVTLAVPARDRGVFVRPELGKEVTISFVEGDPDRPFVLGLLWAKADEPAPGGDDGGGNGWVKIRLTFRSATRSKGRSSELPGNPGNRW